jgi:hypothetical protein
LILYGQIYGPGLGSTKTRRGLGPDWTTVFTLRADTARPKNCLGFTGPNPFGTKHDRLGPGWPGPAQFPALALVLLLVPFVCFCRVNRPRARQAGRALNYKSTSGQRPNPYVNCRFLLACRPRPSVVIIHRAAPYKVLVARFSPSDSNPTPTQSEPTKHAHTHTIFKKWRIAC